MGQCCPCTNVSKSYVDFLWTVRFLGESLVALPPVKNIKNVVCLQYSYMSGHDCPRSLYNNLCDRTKTVTGGLSLHYWLIVCPCVPCNSFSSACYPRQFINSSPSMLWKQSSWDDKYYDHPSFERRLTSLISRTRAPHQGQRTYRTQRASWAEGSQLLHVTDVLYAEEMLSKHSWQETGRARIGLFFRLSFPGNKLEKDIGWESKRMRSVHWKILSGI